MDNLRLATEIYASFARGDIPAVLAAFEPNIQWREAEGNPYRPDGTAWVGPQSVLDKLFRSLGADWDRFTVSVKTLHGAGDYVVMEGRYTGTYKPSGRKLDAQACHVLRFSNGKLSSFQQYTDTAQFQAVMTTT
jgi:uncharacterized protein